MTNENERVLERLYEDVWHFRGQMYVVTSLRLPDVLAVLALGMRGDAVAAADRRQQRQLIRP